MKNKKYLYIIRCSNSNFYKIGSSENPKKRLQMLQGGCPYPLNLIYKRRYKKATETERFLHKKYQNKQKIREWFEFSETEIEQIKYGIGQTPQEQIMDDLLPKHISMLNKIRAIDGLPPIKI